MKVACCGCGKDMGDKPDCIGMEGKISHGYCPECLKKQLDPSYSYDHEKKQWTKKTKSWLIHSDQPVVITKKLSEFKLSPNEFFGWYNPSNGYVMYLPAPYSPAQPNNEWFAWHSHPIGNPGKPSEVDMINSLLSDNNHPQYVSASDGLFLYQMTDKSKAYDKWTKLQNTSSVYNLSDFSEKRDLLRESLDLGPSDPTLYGHIVKKIK